MFFGHGDPLAAWRFGTSRHRLDAGSIVTVALRRLGTIRAALAGLLENGLPRQAAHLEWTLIAASAQILFLDVPDHAAVDLAVRMTRLEAKCAPYASLVNGVLRNLIRAREKILLESDPLDHDTPAWLAERWRKTYGEAAAHAIASAHREEPTLDLTVLSDPLIWAERLGANVLPTGSLRLWTHLPVTGLPGFAEGRWFVQDAAAALPARLLRVGPGTRVADFCAAPGGKAAQLAATGADVTAIDRSAERLKKLAANFARLNLRANIVVADIVNFKTVPFDAILVDAPCLATGTIRRHPDIAWIKKPRDIVALTALQTRLLDKAVELVKPGGMIVYCTCSLEPEENEMQIAALLRRNPGIVRVPSRARRGWRFARSLERKRRIADIAVTPSGCRAAAFRPRWFLRRPPVAPRLINPIGILSITQCPRWGPPGLRRLCAHGESLGLPHPRFHRVPECEIEELNPGRRDIQGLVARRGSPCGSRGTGFAARPRCARACRHRARAAAAGDGS